MSTPDQPNDPIAPSGARPDTVVVDSRPARPVKPTVVRPAPRSGGGVAAAVLLALIAVAGSGYVGWRQWQWQQSAAIDSQGMTRLQQRVGAVETGVATVTSQRSGLTQRIDDAAQVNRALREELLTQADRTRQLEGAVAGLAEKSLSGHDAMLLDETGSLLRMAGERYALFHDAQGAAAAYALAAQTLAAVNDGAFSGLRQSIDAERQALIKSEPVSQAGALQQLSQLRGALASLPLKPLNDPVAQGTDAWARIGRALAGVITVQRDNGAPLAVADARFARELAALDLAQAQAALLAFDSVEYSAALKRVDVSLAQQFDLSVPAVQQARTALAALLAQVPVDAAVPLGAALTELRNLRSVHALSPATGLAAPAPAASVAPADGARP